MDAPACSPVVTIRRSRYYFFMNGAAYYYSDSTDVECIFTGGQARNYPWHMHTRHWAVGLVRSGTVTLTTKAGGQTLRDGQRFVISPCEPHSLTIAAGSFLLVFCFGNRDAFATMNRLLLERVFPAPLSRGREYLLAESLALACTTDAFPGEKGFWNVPALPNSLVSRSVQAVMLLMQEDPGTFASLEQMAAHAGYSRWHFLRAFQKFAGMTPHAFQLLCRLRLLRGLLRADTASAVAAASAGFSDQSHMHRVFKQHHGMTPGQFKQASFRLEL